MIMGFVKLPTARGACATAMGVLATVLVLVSTAVPVPAQADFGLREFDVTFTNADGSPATQAGSHPFAMTTSVGLNGSRLNSKSEVVPDGELKNLTVEQIAGLVGDPSATPRCSTKDFSTFKNGKKNSSCPDSTAVGISETRVAGGIRETRPVFNVVPPPGVAVKLGFVVFTVPVTIEVEVKQEYPYNIRAVSSNTPQPVEFFGSRILLWGNPADPAHDPYRGDCLKDEGTVGAPISEGNCPSGIPDVPFLTLPRACAGPLSTTYEADSWENPDVFVQGFSEMHDNAEPANSLGFGGCSRLGFGPTITAQPTSLAAQSPTGLDVGLNVHDEGLTNPTGIAQSDIKKAVVTLPEGMTANPSLAEGLNVCSEEDLARETVSSAPGEGCPNESKIGTVEVETPLLEEPLKGSLFIAKPYANPFDSLLALYFVIRNPKLGIMIKQPAKVEPNLQTGQLVTVVENIPQLPFSHFGLHFREGARSPLVTPPACGTYNAKAVLTPSSGGAPVTTTSMFQIISGANAGSCPAGGVPPFAPQTTTGTLNNNAGAYSPFDLRITRKDGEQELTRFSTIMPPGLTGNLTGIPFCSDAAIEASKRKTGAQETAEPSCPIASQIGHTLVGAGVGGTLAWAPGKVYLAGPYHGAALSIVSITSATVGPFDLGTVVIRFALKINPITAQVEIDSAGSDAIPHIIDGIVVNVREIHAYVDREKFILNPTNCNRLSITNTVTGAGVDFTNPADQNPVTVASSFQAADCSSLGFKPSFKASTSGKTSRANGASLNVKLIYPKAPEGSQSNIRSVKVDLPKQLPSRLTTLQKACTDSQFDTNPAGCPSASIVGHATAITPILPVPLTGPAYFVSHGGAKFPELVVVLQGYGITIDLHGETFISPAGITSSTFHTVPDQPVTSFELTLPQGKYSALAANGNLCTLTKTVLTRKKVSVNVNGRKRTVTRKVKHTLPAALAMPTVFTAQNGTTIHQSTPIVVTGCQKATNKKIRSETKKK
jgi:hypothetical protein